MPRKPRDLGSYPQMYFEIVERIRRGEKLIQHRVGPDRKLAISTAHDFNRFKQAMARERHPLFEHAVDTICRITNLAGQGQQGEYILEFIPRGMAIAADESRGSMRGLDSPLREELDVPGLNEPATAPDTGIARLLDTQPKRDDEEELRRLLGNPTLAGECKLGEHEADPDGIRCLKCGRPMDAK